MDRQELLSRLARVEPPPPEPDTRCPPRETLQALRRGELSGDERDAVEAHLAHCRRCVDLLLCAEIPTPTLSPTARNDLFQRLRATQTAPARRTPWWVAIGLAPALAAALVLQLTRPSGEAVPPYEIHLESRVLEVRDGAAPAPSMPIITPDSALVIQLLPEQRRPAQLPLPATYLLEPDGVYHLLPIQPVIRQDPALGLIELRFPAREVVGDRYGLHRLRVLLLPSGAVPPPSIDADSAPDIPGAVLLEQSFDYRPPASPPQ